MYCHECAAAPVTKARLRMHDLIAERGAFRLSTYVTIFVKFLCYAFYCVHVRYNFLSLRLVFQVFCHYETVRPEVPGIFLPWNVLVYTVPNRTAQAKAQRVMINRQT